MSSFAVKTQEFEGPIEFLLQLIEEKKLEINRVALAEVTESFLQHLKQASEREDLNKDLTANFLVVAATLMLIKSVTLLPALEVGEEEEISMEKLEARLSLYRLIKGASRRLGERFGRETIYFRLEKKLTVVFAPPANLTAAVFSDLLREVIAVLPPPEMLFQTIIKKTISLEAAAADLTARIQRALRISFQDFVKDKKHKVNVIISFLGLLELIKRGEVTARQTAPFEEISVEASGSG